MPAVLTRPGTEDDDLVMSYANRSWHLSVAIFVLPQFVRASQDLILSWYRLQLLL